MTNYVDIVIYGESINKELYDAELNQTLIQLLGDDGWVLPSLTAAEVVALTASIPTGAQWFNSGTQKMQIRTAVGVETITSAP